MSKILNFYQIKCGLVVLFLSAIAIDSWASAETLNQIEARKAFNTRDKIQAFILSEDYGSYCGDKAISYTQCSSWQYRAFISGCINGSILTELGDTFNFKNSGTLTHEVYPECDRYDRLVALCKCGWDMDWKAADDQILNWARFDTPEEVQAFALNPIYEQTCGGGKVDDNACFLLTKDALEEGAINGTIFTVLRSQKFKFKPNGEKLYGYPETQGTKKILAVCPCNPN